MKTTLPRELVSLVYHVELNSSGWWNDAFQQLILATLLSEDKPINLDSICTKLQLNYGLKILKSRLETILNLMLKQSKLVMAGDDYKIPESDIRKYRDELEKAKELEKKVKSYYLAALDSCGVKYESERAWKLFQDELLKPMIEELGAGLYEFVSGKDGATRYDLNGFLKEFSVDKRRILRSTLIRFLNPDNLDVREYIIGQLNAHFFVLASGLTEDTVNKLHANIGETRNLKLFVDTNFLLSVLGLRDSSSNNEAVSLMSLIRKMRGGIRVTLHVLPQTIDEAKRVLHGVMTSFDNLVISPKIASVAINNMAISDIEKKFFETIVEKNVAMSSSEYFKPIYANLLTIARDKSIQLYNESEVSTLKNDEGVIDDISKQMYYEETSISNPSHRKTHDQLEHDVVMWHFVNNSRPPIIESPMEAARWVVTVDHRLVSFDRYKRSQSHLSYPVCVLPSTLIQMFQFWVPMSSDLQKSMVNGVLIPLLSRYDSDHASERAALKILSVLARWENSADLPTSTIEKIILNEALNKSIKEEPILENQVKLVREALIDENKGLDAELSKTKKGLESATTIVVKKHTEAEELRSKKSKYEQKIGELERVVEDNQAVIDQLVGDKKRRELEMLVRRARTNYVFISFCIVVSLTVIYYLVDSTKLVSNYNLTLIIQLLFLIIAIYLITLIGKKSPYTSEWWVYKLFNYVLWPLHLFCKLLVAILPDAIWDYIKSKVGF